MIDDRHDAQADYVSHLSPGDVRLMVLVAGRVTSGKCQVCNKRFVWTGNVKLRNAGCPYCDTPIRRTTHLWRGETITISRPAVHYAPRGITQTRNYKGSKKVLKMKWRN